MPLYTKRKTKLHRQLTNSDQATCHGGQVLVNSICRRFGLWQRLQNEPALDPRKCQGAGLTPAANVAQVLFTLTSGGASLAAGARVGEDRGLMNLLGLDKGADQATLGEFLRAQTPESVRALHRLCIPAGWLRWWRHFVPAWVPKRKPGRPVLEVVDSGQAFKKKRHVKLVIPAS